MMPWIAAVNSDSRVDGDSRLEGVLRKTVNCTIVYCISDVDTEGTLRYRDDILGCVGDILGILTQ